MSILDKSKSFVGENIDIFYFTPQGKMSQEHFVKLSNSMLITRQTIVADVKCLSFFCKRAHTFHILSKATKTCSSKNIFGLINGLTIFNGRNFMQESAVDSTSAASSCKKKAIVSSTFLIEEICCCVADIQFRVTFSECSLLVFLIFGADVLAEPEVILLISLFICIIIRQTCFYLFTGWSFHSFGEHKIFLFFFLDEFFWDEFIDIESWIGVAFE